jgi:hypothetical protein
MERADVPNVLYTQCILYAYFPLMHNNLLTAMILKPFHPTDHRKSLYVPPKGKTFNNMPHNIDDVNERLPCCALHCTSD